MANDVPQSPEAAGKEFATKINDAVYRNDSKLYADTMAGINDWTKNNGDKTQKFDESLIGNVDLKTAALYETKENFDKIDKIGKKDDRVKPDELQAYAKSSDTNALQKAMIEKQILPQYESIANNSSDRVFSSIWRDDHIRKIDLDKGLETAAANRPEKKLTEEQVAEKVKTPGFTAEALDYTKDNFTAIDTSKNNKLDKKELETFGADASRTPLQKAYINQGILPKFDDFANASKDHKLGLRDTEIRQGDLDKSLASEYAKPEVQAAVKELAPNNQLKDLATVRKGEGPFHSAERILKAAGGEHGIDEVRALTKALKTMYNDEGHGDLKDLKVKHNFVTEKNFNKLIESVNNDKVREALKKLAAA